MGNTLFGVDISGLVNQNIGPGVLAATLTVYTTGARTPGQPTKGTNPTNVVYPCKGFIAKTARKDIDGTLVDDGTVTIILIGDSISGGAVAPKLEDRITIEGRSYTIKVIDRDPAAATYTCVSRRI